MKQLFERLKTGIFTENPIFIQMLGMCPTLAVTTSANDGIGMGLATTAVLIASNIVISLLRNIIPNKVRIPAFIVIIASFVTIVDLVMQAYLNDLHGQLGIFIPLIVVNCAILGRAESYASKNKVFPSIFDGIGMGLGFTLALGLIGATRELLGVGTILGMQIVPDSIPTIGIFVLAPGAFFVLGMLLAVFNHISNKKSKEA
ncbi:electron transport complex protein RnfE [Natranaerovirga hydrolytica]|uniref:Ion-translocating oxidoreductase complex subunit E n=1 Tax=Natranaerovirga hydrolytica TaxID=680378 RepID=A0A4R1MZN3_9FIRM|nr:electron transport complex subunit E [Natranaerovirga hydrolytica]TCK98080.1 electron transport complex protein RnfE [Natranaerovirga hydrolytica]